MSAELQFHVEERAAFWEREGLAPEEALRRARVEFGGREHYKEECRDALGWRLLDELRQDLRYALRALRSHAGFSTVAILSIALGVGANTAIFSLLNAVTLKTLPVPHAEQLAMLRKTSPVPVEQRFSDPAYRQMRDALPAPAMLLAAGRVVRMNAQFGDAAQFESLRGQLVSGNFFSALGVEPSAGRLLSAADDVGVDAHPVAVISYGLWQRRFGGSASVVGRGLDLNGAHFTIVGVGPRDFSGIWMDTAVDIWLPLTMQNAVRYASHFSVHGGDADKPWAGQPGISWLDIVVREPNLEAGPDWTRLNSAFAASLAAVAGRFGRADYQRLFLMQRVRPEPFNSGFSNLRSEFSKPLTVLMVMVGIVLLITCTNVANLLLARATARQREIAVRLSLGARRGRVIRQLLTESMVLAIAGGMLGLLLAHWSSALLARMAVGPVAASFLQVGLDTRVLLFSVAASLIAALVFGTGPALRTTRLELSTVTKSGGRALYGGSRMNAMKMLVALQITLCLVLLVAAGLFSRSLQNLYRLNPGFDQEHLLSVRMDLHTLGYREQQLAPLYDRLMQRVGSVPGVQSVAVSSCELAANCEDSSGVKIQGYEPRSGEQVEIQENFVSANYLHTVGMELMQGRDFTQSDGKDDPKVAIINQAAAKRYFSGRNPVGQRFGYKKQDIEIVGIVADARVNDPHEAAPPMAFYPIAQTDAEAGSLDVRTSGDPEWMKKAVQSAVTEVDPHLGAERIVTLPEQLSTDLARDRLTTILTSAFSALALVLACVGLYGVMAYAVARRTAELGIRVALGAARSTVLWMVLRESLGLITAGLGVGIVLVLLGAKVIASMLFGVDAYDFTTIGASVAILLLVPAFAALAPAARASRTDPLTALRHE